VKKCIKKAKIALIAVLAIALSTIFFANKKTQGVNWTFPYFSGAANFDRFFDWRISPSDFGKVKSLNENSYWEYKHQRTNDLKENTVNNYGYVLIALFARHLFPHTGDLKGAVYLQIGIHSLTCLFFTLFILDSKWKIYSFIVFYAANPLIIHFVTFPFYYFWLFVPSFFYALLILKPNWSLWTGVIACPLLVFALLIRPTPIFLAIFFFLLAIYYQKNIKRKIVVSTMFLFFLAGFISLRSVSSSGPWHTIYVGIGAYPNNVGVKSLSDNEAYDYFNKISGVYIDTDAISGNYNNPKLRNAYLNSLKMRYFKIAKSNPLLLLRNAILNSLQVFSVGYIVDRPLLTWLSAGLGGFVLLFLLLTRQGLWVVAIYLSALGFVLYYPPIPAYNIAAYLLLCLGCLQGLQFLLGKNKSVRIAKIA